MSLMPSCCCWNDKKKKKTSQRWGQAVKREKRSVFFITCVPTSTQVCVHRGSVHCVRKSIHCYLVFWYDIYSLVPLKCTLSLSLSLSRLLTHTYTHTQSYCLHWIPFFLIHLYIAITAVTLFCLISIKTLPFNFPKYNLNVIKTFVPSRMWKRCCKWNTLIAIIYTNLKTLFVCAELKKRG